ncbi:DNA-3-methyladenine glycosylase family protein [Caballeronia sordidicola]|uniref:DNA-3-methyladenine glycosylase II n=1 Tax=Caballeronia sordidicola TaxID=196367 RepID=A0A242N7E8_CABSO|nr:AlkA N-terminal domain-containing protein [Caballeronia sordidicola]OTP79086.1 DNA-3-methyladenine glycosylase II [Caballeronia sordidicola]
MKTASDSSAIKPVRLQLPFVEPYDWPRVLRFFAGRATLGVETVEDGAYKRAIEWLGEPGTLSVTRHATKPCLVATIDGAASRHAKPIGEHLTRMFDLRADATAITAHLARDPWFAPLTQAVPGLRVPGAWSGFELVVRAIVGQQVSVKAASTIIGRLVQRAGTPVPDHAHADTAWRFPTPAALAQVDLDKIGMPGKRVAALQGFAREVATGALPLDDPRADRGELRAALLAMPGIGPWTVEYVAMRALRDPDAWPGTDLILMQALAARDPSMAKAAALRARAENWRPYRAYAALHVWNEIADRAGSAKGG